ncbi:MAG: type II secretion system protein [Ruminococcus sp.]|nr:type II secretion system protein [Ruminococcus sp.]
MKRKGFTLMELIVVIAIFGILVAVITPASAAYITRSKFRVQNQKSKAIFNAAQVVLTDLEFTERKYFTAYETTTDSNQKIKLKKHLYTPLDHSDWFYYWDGHQGYMCDAKGNAINMDDSTTYPDKRKTYIAEWNDRMGQSIRRIVTDEMVYKIWVHDYNVVSVACADKAHSRFIGAHPTTIYDLDDSVDTDPLEHTTVKDIDLSWFDLDATNDGTLITGT